MAHANLAQRPPGSSAAWRDICFFLPQACAPAPAPKRRSFDNAFEDTFPGHAPKRSFANAFEDAFPGHTPKRRGLGMCLQPRPPHAGPERRSLGNTVTNVSETKPHAQTGTATGAAPFNQVTVAFEIASLRLDGR